MKDGFMFLVIAGSIFVTGACVGFTLEPTVPVFDVTIKAPGAPNPSIVFTPEEYLRGVTDGIKIGRATQFSEDLRIVHNEIEKIIKERERWHSLRLRKR